MAQPITFKEAFTDLNTLVTLQKRLGGAGIAISLRSLITQQIQTLSLSERDSSLQSPTDDLASLLATRAELLNVGCSINALNEIIEQQLKDIPKRDLPSILPRFLR